MMIMTPMVRASAAETIFISKKGVRIIAIGFMVLMIAVFKLKSKIKNPKRSTQKDRAVPFCLFFADIQLI